jgi:hypothetical protein
VWRNLWGEIFISIPACFGSPAGGRPAPDRQQILPVRARLTLRADVAAMGRPSVTFIDL